MKLTPEERKRAAQILVSIRRWAMHGIPAPPLKPNDWRIVDLLLAEKGNR